MLAKRLLLLAGLLAPVFAQEFDDEFDFVEDELDERSGYDEHNGCTKSVQIVALPGGDSVRGELSYLQSLANDIQAAIPHSEIYEIGYPEGADPPTAIEYGTKHLNEHFRDYTKRCPHTGIVTLGYSVGGAAAMNVYCGNVTGGTHQLPSHFYKNVVANIIYGDLTYIPNLKYDAGTCTTSPGVVPRQYPGKCAPFGKKTKSYCDEGDPECCGGDDPSVHFSYPATYDGDATNYVVGRWHHFQKHHKKRHGKKGGH